MAVFRQASAEDLQNIPSLPINESDPTATEVCKFIDFTDLVKKKRKAGIVISDEEVVEAHQKQMKVGIS